VVLEKAGNPEGATIYFDEIRYEGPLTAVALTLADNVPPRLALTVSPKEFSPSDGSNVLFKLAASDNTGIESWRLEIANPDGKLVRVFESDGTPPSSISWDGKDDYYNQPVPPGIYRAILRADDTVGNVSNTDPVTIKATGPEPQVKEVVKEVIKEVPREIKVVEEERGLRVTLTSTVLFDSGKYDLKPQASTALAEVADLLKQYPDNRVRIEGHTDSVGNDEYNQGLSEKRAQSVANYIVQKHQIDEKRLETVGLGESKPIAPNTTSSGRSQNRRVEIIILK
jgi:outer membrane protein OmpA-like peptidoglycan-associated protein